jgi:hypothetical protein
LRRRRRLRPMVVCSVSQRRLKRYVVCHPAFSMRERRWVTSFAVVKRFQLSLGRRRGVSEITLI